MERCALGDACTRLRTQLLTVRDMSAPVPYVCVLSLGECRVGLIAGVIVVCGAGPSTAPRPGSSDGSGRAGVWTRRAPRGRGSAVTVLAFCWRDSRQGGAVRRAGRGRRDEPETEPLVFESTEHVDLHEEPPRKDLPTTGIGF